MAIWTNARLLGLVAAIALGGCASTKEDVIPQGGPDMRTIYEQHQRQTGTVERLVADRTLANRRPLKRGQADLHAYTREVATELDQVFPLLPNPQLVMYVYPHLSGEGAPVPGYSTAFPMYEVDQYAFPGEAVRP